MRGVDDDAAEDGAAETADDDLADVVPVALLQPRPFSEPRPLSAFSFARLLGCTVRLRVNGFDVTGEFRGADEDEVYLRGELRWFVYPMSAVTGVTVLHSPADDDDGDDERDNDDDDGDIRAAIPGFDEPATPTKR